MSAFENPWGDIDKTKEIAEKLNIDLKSVMMAGAGLGWRF